MFSFIQKAIRIVCNASREFIYGDTAFTRNYKWSMEDYANHIIFNHRKTLRNNIDTHLEYCTSDIGTYRKQSFSKQRMNINPLLFKEINLNYLDNIGYLNSSQSNPLYRRFYGFNLYACDGSRFTLYNTEKTLKEFNFPENYDRVPKVIFSGVVDVLNDFMIDGIMGQRGIGELKLVHQNIKNCMNFVNPLTSIFLFDRGYVSTELICRLILLKTYFVIRLKKDSYKEEREEISTNDSPLKLNITEERLNKFKDEEVKGNFKENQQLDLRLVTINLESGEEEYLLTNIPSELFNTKEIGEIYDERWGVERAFKTIKQRLQVENFTTYSKIGILQDIYSTIITYNIFCQFKSLLNIIINRTMGKKGKTTYYEVEHSFLISVIKKYLFKLILNPTRENIRHYIKKIIINSMVSPNKVKEPRTYIREKKIFKCKYYPKYKPAF